jgi:hypothetical protein
MLKLTNTKLPATAANAHPECDLGHNAGEGEANPSNCASYFVDPASVVPLPLSVLDALLSDGCLPRNPSIAVGTVPTVADSCALLGVVGFGVVAPIGLVVTAGV